MPVGYKFVDRATGKAATIKQVDDEICSYRGIKPDDEICSLEYEAIVSIGTVAAWHTGVASVEEVEKAIKTLEDKNPDFKSDNLPDMVREFLIKRYQFEAWREWKH